ncbi:MAG TPA: hypothetical protein VMU60_05390 [Syntrophobacteria bacterium]|nr:hypothetical protein [Syntrophobacteria bacterium]
MESRRTGGWVIFLLLLGLGSVVVQCSQPLSHQPDQVPNRPRTETFDVNEGVLRKAVERVFAKKSYPLDPQVTTAHHLQSRWVEEGFYRAMLIADLSSLKKNQTELTLRVLLEKRGMWSKVWSPTDEIGMDTYDLLMNDVSTESYRVLYEGG